MSPALVSLEDYLLHPDTNSISDDTFLICNNNFYNVITPNGDGKNDSLFLCFSSPDSSLLSVFIYDKSGTLIHKTEGITSTRKEQLKFVWDGTSNGKPAPEGPYYYEVSCRDKRGIYMNEKGVVNVFRNNN